MGNGVYIIMSIGEVVDLSNILNAINSMFSGSLGYGFNLVNLFIVLLAVLIFIIAFITTVYTAMTIRKSIFSEIKFGGLISFIIFLLINWVVTTLSNWLLGGVLNISPYYDSMNTIVNTGMSTTETLIMALLPTLAVLTIQIIALTGLSGYLLEKEINL